MIVGATKPPGAYGLLESRAVDAATVALPMFAATARGNSIKTLARDFRVQSNSKIWLDAVWAAYGTK